MVGFHRGRTGWEKVVVVGGVVVGVVVVMGTGAGGALVAVALHISVATGTVGHGGVVV